MNWRPNFESMDKLGEKVCPTFSFTIENKIENSHKKVWSHIKLNLDN